MRKGRSVFLHSSVFYVPSILLMLSAISCGRRGDPFLPSPYDMQKEQGKSVVDSASAKDEKLNDSAVTEVVKPDAPSDLKGLFTGNSVVLTWSEVENQGVRSYHIYRAEDTLFEKLGETAVPAFIDEDMKKGIRNTYRYKVTAVGNSESDFSNEIAISTED